ncbi:hypothetical protein SE17_19070, partial [Kouleothrix aurantiaca]
MVHDITKNPPATAPAAPSVWDRAHWQITLGLLLVISGAAFEALAVATILPATVRDLGGLNLYGWAFSAFMLANLVGITIAGAEADRQGPARPLILGAGVFVVGLLIVGFAPSMLVVIAGRAVQGFGSGVISSVAYVSIGRGYPEALKPRMLAMSASAWVIPGLIGRALAGVIADMLGWRWVFLGLVPFILLGAGLALPGLRPLSGNSDSPREWRTARLAVMLAAGAGMALAALTTPNTLLAVALGVAGLALGIPSLLQLLPAGT